MLTTRHAAIGPLECLVMATLLLAAAGYAMVCFLTSPRPLNELPPDYFAKSTRSMTSMEVGTGPVQVSNITLAQGIYYGRLLSDFPGGLPVLWTSTWHLTRDQFDKWLRPCQFEMECCPLNLHLPLAASDGQVLPFTFDAAVLSPPAVGAGGDALVEVKLDVSRGGARVPEFKGCPGHGIAARGAFVMNVALGLSLVCPLDSNAGIDSHAGNQSRARVRAQRSVHNPPRFRFAHRASTCTPRATAPSSTL